MAITRATLLTTTMLLIALAISASAIAQTSASRTAGFDIGLPPSEPIVVTYDPSELHWQLQVDLIFDPTAPPMEKHFLSPVSDAGPIQLDAQQPFPQPIWEDFLIVSGPPVVDWHEEILTPGWEWLLPGDARIPDPIPDPFRADESLITKDGLPWPSDTTGMPDIDPAKLWVDFPPIVPGEVLDVHKALLWVGTPGNRAWGDNALDDGTVYDESLIRVIEYPTPEPASLSLLAWCTVGLLLWRRSRALDAQVR